MTNEDIKVVEQKVQLERFVYDLLRLVEEGIPVMRIYPPQDDLHHAMERIADVVLAMRGTDSETPCKCVVGDKVKCVAGFEEVSKVFRVADFVEMRTPNGRCQGVVVCSEEFAMPFVYPVALFNDRFEKSENNERND